MRGLRFALTIACVLAALGHAGPAAAQGGGGQGTFTLRVCNNSGGNALLSVAHRVNPSDQRFVVRGWFALTPGCSQAEMPLGFFYYFALPAQGEGYWGGNTNVCVDVRGNFERIITPNYQCQTGEVLAPFQEVEVTSPGVYTVNLNR